MVHQRDPDGFWQWDFDDDGIYARPAGEYIRPPQPLLVTGTDRRLAVGTEYYRQALRGRRAGARCRVELVPEPGNPYDNNAVAIDLEGVRIGYLSAGEAERRQPGIRWANAMGYHVLADGKFERIGGDLAVRMMLPHPSDLLSWLSKPEQQRTAGYGPPVRLTVRGLDHFQKELLAVIGPRERASVAGQLDPRPVATGKRSGSCDARVLVDGTEVGAVRAVDLEGEPRVQRALRRGPLDCQVDLVRYPERVWAAVVAG